MWRYSPGSWRAAQRPEPDAWACSLRLWCREGLPREIICTVTPRHALLHSHSVGGLSGNCRARESGCGGIRWRGLARRSGSADGDPVGCAGPCCGVLMSVPPSRRVAWHRRSDRIEADAESKQAAQGGSWRRKGLRDARWFAIPGRSHAPSKPTAPGALDGSSAGETRCPPSSVGMADRRNVGMALRPTPG